MPTKTVNGTTFSYEERGSGKPLVLLHGFPLDARVFAAQLDALSDSYRVIAPDLRGFGKSASIDPFTIASLAEDVHALLGAIDALPCVLGGLSMGGYVALAAFKKWPRDFSGLILIDTRATGDTPEGKQGRDKMIELVRKQGSKAVAEQMLPKMLCTDCATRNPQARARVIEIMESCPPRTIEHALLAMRDREDYSSELPSISEPTLILVGLHDAITPPEMAEGMKKQIPRSTLEIIPEAAHLTPIEQPAKVNEAIRRFMKQVS